MWAVFSGLEMEGNVLVNGVSALDVDPGRPESYAMLMNAVVAENPTHSRLDGMGFAHPAVSEQMDENGERSSRHPRWSKEETVVLVEAKRKQEEDARQLSLTGRAFSANEKWEFVQAFCKVRGVDRDAQQCRKRWSNLYGEYRKIKDWCMQNQAENYWALRRDRRKDAKLPGTFEFEIFAVMDSFISKRTGGTPGGTPGPETWRTNEDDEDMDGQEEFNGHPMGDPGAGDEPCPPGTGVFHEDQMDQADEIYGRRKKRRTDDINVLSAMESTGRALENVLLKSAQAQIDAYNRNSELDRIQKKSVSDNLVGVLDKLAEAICKVADRL